MTPFYRSHIALEYARTVRMSKYATLRTVTREPWYHAALSYIVGRFV